MMNLYFFQWISELGGADTRAKDLIKLFSENKNYNVIVVPNDDFRLDEKENVDFILSCGAKCLSWKDLPQKSDGYALALCNFRLFEENEKWRLKKIKKMGLRFVWLNDMMWRSKEEEEAIKNFEVDIHVYTSEIHKYKLSSKSSSRKKEFIIPNFFSLDRYSFIERKRQTNSFSIGKHSRPDLAKFSDSFPLFYENLKLKNPRYRVMGVDEDFKEKFSWFDFSDKWDLLKPNQEDTSFFLGSLDCYIYNSHFSFIENQSRAIVEAALSGLPIIAPRKYNFPNQIWHERTGFLWDSYEECRYYSNLLENDLDLRMKMGKSAHVFAKDIWGDKDHQLNLWKEVFRS